MWHEVGTHIATTKQSATPTNISDGFYYIPLLSTLELLLNNTCIFHQVWQIVIITTCILYGSYISIFKVMSGQHQSPGEVLLDICDGTIFSSNSLLNSNETALQIIGYYDEFTVTNPLMSRAKKYKIGMAMLG